MIKKTPKNIVDSVAVIFRIWAKCANSSNQLNLENPQTRLTQAIQSEGKFLRRPKYQLGLQNFVAFQSKCKTKLLSEPIVRRKQILNKSGGLGCWKFTNLLKNKHSFVSCHVRKMNILLQTPRAVQSSFSK